MKLSEKLQDNKTKRQQQNTIPHVIIEARAGTGKTTTLIEGLKLLKGFTPSITPSLQQQAVWDLMMLSKDAATIGFVAFNKSIAEELKKRVPEGCTACTMHSLGFSAVKNEFDIDEQRVRMNKWRVFDIISELTGKDIRELRKHQSTLVKATEKLVGLCKSNLIGVEDFAMISEEELDSVCGYYDIDIEGHENKIFNLVPQVLERCLDVARDGCIDFNDMIWIPVALGLSVSQYDLLLVDECLPGWTPVMMDNGESKSISEIKVGDIVRSYNTEKSRAGNCRVSAVQKIPNKKPLVKIRAKHNHKTNKNTKANFVVCTTDHKIWTNNRGWVQAGDVQIGDEVIIETSAKTTQKGKISKQGRDKLSKIHQGNKKGLGNSFTSAEQFNSIKGGNGRGLTVPQQLLLESLGDEWKAEYVVKTGDAPQFGRGDKPSHYKIDLAHPHKKIAIELDGDSHSSEESKNKDAKKDKFLASQGWSVFRFTNRDVAKDFAGILQDVCPDGSNCPMPATVESVEETYISEYFVYDITVEDYHNFYANGILVHNCQDLSRCQQALAKMSGQRLILVGDSFQAIYGFAGADSESMNRLEEELKGTIQTEIDERTPQICNVAHGLPAYKSELPHNTGDENNLCRCWITGPGCEVLPLTVTYRCGKAIVAEANKIVPDFHAHESNCKGKISERQYETDDDENPNWYANYVQDKDMILCRVNAPLVSQCFKFLKAGRKANIQGRDIGQGLISTIQKLVKQHFKIAGMDANIADLKSCLSDWLHREQEKENQKRNPSNTRLIALQDRYDCLSHFMKDANTVDDVIKSIEAIFTDDKDLGGILLSSGHRAKGLESDRVFILRPRGAECPHPMAKSDWQKDQEMNILYVMITRAKKELVYVS